MFLCGVSTIAVVIVNATGSLGARIFMNRFVQRVMEESEKKKTKKKVSGKTSKL